MSQRRRDFLRISGLAAALAGFPAAAWATRIRVLDDGGEQDRILAPAQPNPDLRRFIAGLRLGPPRSHGVLTVFWLNGEGPAPPLDVATLDDARAQGALLISERGEATVPELIVENRGKAHVLLLAGEILVGGKQNRVLREDLLLPPRSGPRNLGVYCVEQGRWNTGRQDFESKSTLAAPTLRSELMQKADQSRVWAEVGRQAQVAQAPSPTRSYQEIFEKPEVKDHLKELERAGDWTPPVSALGAAVFTGTTAAGIDLFLNAPLFKREWPKLLRAAALESYRQALSPADPQALRETVKAVLRRAATADGIIRGNAGVGQLFEFSVGSSRGSALLYTGSLVHAAIL
jgi:hypothetical protein